MKTFALVVVALIGCSKKSGDAPTAGSAAATGSAIATGRGSAAAEGAGSAAVQPVEDVSCKDAAKEYATKMAKSPGNVLSDAKPDDGLVHWTALSMEDYCVGEDGCCVPWTPQERACVKSASPATVAACFSGASLSQVNAGLNEVVTNALAQKKKNEEAAKATGSGAATP